MSKAPNVIRNLVARFETQTYHDKRVIERQIKADDDEIDRLVYELYGLSEDEVGIVEGAE